MSVFYDQIGGYAFVQTLAERSAEIADIACESAGDGNGWNARFLAELGLWGYSIHPISPKTQLGPDGPVWAPKPVEGPDAYPYPSVIAPIGWNGPES